MSITIRLFTIIAAFVTGAFLSYLLQLWLLSTDGQMAMHNGSDGELLPTAKKSTAVEIETTDFKVPRLLEPEPENQTSNVTETGLLAIPTKDEPVAAPTPEEPIEILAEEINYELVIVKPGDSLSKIAIREYGNQDHAISIFEANRDILKSPDLLVPGMQLKVPVNP